MPARAPDPPSFDALFARHQGRLEDFWGRRANRPRWTVEEPFFDRRVLFRSNQEEVLAAVAHSQPLFSRAAVAPAPPLEVQLVVQAGPGDPGPPPEDLFAAIRYTGDGQWLALQLGAWGLATVDLAAGQARLVLEPALAALPELVSRCVLNTVLLNLFIGAGYGMLHATGLWQEGRALLLLAPHNAGKSTTALRLALAGYRLISDSMIFLSPHAAQRGQGVQLFGFPVGQARLRRDMVPAFPQLAAVLARGEVQVRQETKFVADLRQVDPALVQAEAVVPESIDLCLLQRGRGRETRQEPASPAALRQALLRNSLYYDAAPAWRANWEQIERLLAQARGYHLYVGSEDAGIVPALAG